MAPRSLSVRGARADPGDGCFSTCTLSAVVGRMNLHADCWQGGGSARCLVNSIVIS
jgi:hypothetical protein